MWGSLIFYKNIDVIINAFDIVTKTIPSAQLIIVGDGPMRIQLSQTDKQTRTFKTIFILKETFQMSKN